MLIYPSFPKIKNHSRLENFLFKIIFKISGASDKIYRVILRGSDAATFKFCLNRKGFPADDKE